MKMSEVTDSLETATGSVVAPTQQKGVSMTELTFDELFPRLSDPNHAAITISAQYQPSAGMGARVYPPTFPTSQSDPKPYLFENRYSSGEERRAVVLDQVPSQANRVEEALLQGWLEDYLPMPMLRLTTQQEPIITLHALDMPHRIFDAYWRDALIDGTKFDKTELGKAIVTADLSDSRAILEHDPASLVFGCWNSHRKGRQAKFPRCYSSEMIGWDPVEGSRKAGRMDPLNLTGSRAGDGDDWKYQAVAAKAKTKLSEIGHGNIAPNQAHGGVTISEAHRSAVLSFTALNRIRFGDLPAEASAAARGYLAAFALVGDRLAFGRAGLWLRSGCDLVMQHEQLQILGRSGEVTEFSLSPESAVTLYTDALDHARKVGVQLELDPVDAVPNDSLAKAIQFSLTKATDSGE